MERSHHKSVQKELREEHRMMEEAEKARAQQESTRAQRAIEKLEKEIRQLDWNRCESEKKSINELQQRDVVSIEPSGKLPLTTLLHCM